MPGSASMQRTYGRLADAYPAGLATARFSASGAYDKLAVLILLAVVSGAAGVLVLPDAALLPAVIVAIGAGLAGIFLPKHARWLAPLYAVAEGVLLGRLSEMYASLGGGIVPTAVVLTGAVFFGCLAIYRTGLVKVTPKFLGVTLAASLGLAAVSLAAAFGLPIPGARELGMRGMLFGLVGMGVGVLNLFVDFSAVEQMEEQGADERGEWYAALALMITLVLVYVYALRTVASATSRR